MDFNPIDILIVVFLLLISLIQFKNGCIKNISKTINLIASIILANLVISNLSIQFTFLKKTHDFLYLSSYFIIFIIFMTILCVIFELIIEQVETLEISNYLDITISIAIGLIRGFILISFLIFIFDTTPSLSKQSRETIYNKVESKSIFFKPCNNLKEILFNNF